MKKILLALSDEIEWLFGRIKNVIFFARIGWKDYWWESSYFEILVIKKLKRMRDGFEKSDRESSREIEKEISLAIDKLEESLHFEERYRKDLDKKYLPPVLFESKAFAVTKEGKEFLETKKGKEFWEKTTDFNFIQKQKERLRQEGFSIISKRLEYWWQ